MREVIMRMDGSGEDSHGLEMVGELVRCKDCVNADWYKAHDERFCYCAQHGSGGYQENDYCSCGRTEEDAV